MQFSGDKRLRTTPLLYLKVRIVERGEDFTIRWVDRNPGVGEWEEVPRLEDFTIRFVESGEDVKVRFVYH